MSSYVNILVYLLAHIKDDWRWHLGTFFSIKLQKVEKTVLYPCFTIENVLHERKMITPKCWFVDNKE